MATAVVSQIPADTSWEWYEADPVSLRLIAVDVDLSGTYDFRMTHPDASRVGVLLEVEVVAERVSTNASSVELKDPDFDASTLVATADSGGAHTMFDVVIDAATSATIPAGKHPADLQERGGVTRFAGSALVAPQVKL